MLYGNFLMVCSICFIRRFALFDIFFLLDISIYVFLKVFLDISVKALLDSFLAFSTTSFPHASSINMSYKQNDDETK